MAYTNKKISINGSNVFFVQGSLDYDLGLEETTTRTQVSGNTVQTIPYANLETKKGSVTFDILVSDSDTDSDPRVLISNWHANNGNNQIIVEPDGVGQTLLFNNATIMNKINIKDSPDGVISISFESQAAILTN
jgi:hypothetical protein